jgi:hypothetical protein
MEMLYHHCFSNFPLGYAISNGEENQVGLKLNQTYHLLVYADDLILLEDNINTIKTQTSIDGNEAVGLKVNSEETKYILLSHYQNVGQIHGVKIRSRSFEYVE